MRLRLRRHHKRNPDAAGDKLEEREKVKVAKPIEPITDMLHQVVSNPNFGIQVVAILLTLTHDNIRMDRRIDTMASTVDKVRGLTEVINSTMNSLKMAAEAPNQIKRLFHPQ